MRSKKVASLVLGISALITLPIEAIANRKEYCPALEIALTGGWFVADGTDTAYAIQRTDDPNLTHFVPTGSLVKISPKYKLLGGLDLNYQSDCCYNWGGSYSWYHHTSNDSVTGGTATRPNIGPVLMPNSVLFRPGNFQFASSNFKFQYDFANIELGSNFCMITDCLIVNPKVGLSYARIRADQTTTYSQLTDDGDYDDTVTMLSRYKGFGPSIGADVNYLFCDNFALFGNFRYSALVGSLNGEWSNVLFDPDDNAVPDYLGNVPFHSKRHLVKLCQSELGLGYTFDWCGFCGGIKVGYQLMQALDCVDRITLLSDFNAGDAGGSALIENLRNARIHGPFIRITAKFGM